MSDRVSKLYELCNKKQYFTSGSNSQYDKLFYMANNGGSLYDLALIIWLCSNNVSSIPELQKEMLDYGIQ